MASRPEQLQKDNEHRNKDRRRKGKNSIMPEKSGRERIMKMEPQGARRPGERHPKGANQLAARHLVQSECRVGLQT